MSTSNLAILGGKPVINKSFEKFNTFGQEEAQAASRVVESGTLSEFIGGSGEFFLEEQMYVRSKKSGQNFLM